jgi:hypothetical protein
VFGDDVSADRIEALRQKILEKDFSWLPEVEWVDDGSLPNGVLGAYVPDTQQILLDSSLRNSSDEELWAVIAEEVGHFVDHQLRLPPGTGVFAAEDIHSKQTWENDRTHAGFPVDEGALFLSALETGQVTPEAWEKAFNDDDWGVVTVGGEELEAEFRKDPAPYLSPGGEGDDWDLYNDIRGAGTPKELDECRARLEDDESIPSATREFLLKEIEKKEKSLLADLPAYFAARPHEAMSWLVDRCEQQGGGQGEGLKKVATELGAALLGDDADEESKLNKGLEHINSLVESAGLSMKGRMEDIVTNIQSASTESEIRGQAREWMKEYVRTSNTIDDFKTIAADAGTEHFRGNVFAKNLEESSSSLWQEASKDYANVIRDELKRIPGQPESTAIAAHGAIPAGATGPEKTFRVPEGVTLTVYTLDGEILPTEIGTMIELGDLAGLEKYKDILSKKTYKAGDTVPEHILGPMETQLGHEIAETSIRVDGKTKLSDLLANLSKQGGGDFHLAACREFEFDRLYQTGDYYNYYRLRLDSLQKKVKMSNGMVIEHPKYLNDIKNTAAEIEFEIDQARSQLTPEQFAELEPQMRQALNETKELLARWGNNQDLIHWGDTEPDEELFRSFSEKKGPVTPGGDGSVHEAEQPETENPVGKGSQSPSELDGPSLRSEFREGASMDNADFIERWKNATDSEIENLLGIPGGNAQSRKVVAGFKGLLERGEVERARTMVNSVSLHAKEITSYKMGGMTVELGKDGTPTVDGMPMKTQLTAEGADIYLSHGDAKLPMRIPREGLKSFTKDLMNTGLVALESAGYMMTVLDLFEAGVAASKGDWKEAGMTFGGTVGGLGGSLLGAHVAGMAGSTLLTLGVGFYVGFIGAAVGSYVGGKIAKKFHPDTFDPLDDPNLDNILYDLLVIDSTQVIERNYASLQELNNGKTPTLQTMKQKRDELLEYLEQGNFEPGGEEVRLFNALSFFVNQDSEAQANPWRRYYFNAESAPNAFKSMQAAGDPKNQLPNDGTFTINDLKAFRGYASASWLSHQYPPPTVASAHHSAVAILDWMEANGKESLAPAEMALLVADATETSRPSVEHWVLALIHLHNRDDPRAPVSKRIFEDLRDETLQLIRDGHWHEPVDIDYNNLYGEPELDVEPTAWSSPS